MDERSTITHGGGRMKATAHDQPTPDSKPYPFDTLLLELRKAHRGELATDLLTGAVIFALGILCTILAMCL